MCLLYCKEILVNRIWQLLNLIKSETNIAMTLLLAVVDSRYNNIGINKTLKLLLILLPTLDFV